MRKFCNTSCAVRKEIRLTAWLWQTCCDTRGRS